MSCLPVSAPSRAPLDLGLPPCAVTPPSDDSDEDEGENDFNWGMFDARCENNVVEPFPLLPVSVDSLAHPYLCR